MGYTRDEYDRVAAAMSAPPPQKETCLACGHLDYATEMYRQAIKGTDQVGTYCRNHNSCQARRKEQFAAAKLTNPQKETTVEFGEYTEPAQAEGDAYKPREHYGNSAIVQVVEYRESVATSNSPNGAPAVIVDVYDLNLKRAFLNVLVMTGALVDGFKPHVGGNPIVVKWERRVANNGRDYPAAVPAVPAAIDAAKAVFANGNPFQNVAQDETQEEAPF